MKWLSCLSKAQRVWLVSTVLVAVAIIIVGAVAQKGAAEEALPAFTVEMNIRDVAHPMGITGKSLARELGLSLDVSKGKPLKALGITQEQLDHVAHHQAGHHDSVLKYYVFVAICLFGLVFMTRLGRPDGSPTAERKSWYPRWPYVVALFMAVVMCGFVLGKSPNPMEGAVKVFKSMVGLYPSVAGKVIALCFFIVLAVIGNKIICGWACPFGALQELIYHLPILRKIKKRKLPFWLTNTIRVALFVFMLLILFGVVGGRKGFVVYHYVNPFNLFNLDIELASIGITIVAALVLSFGFYRPFCQLICPFGLIGWVAERLSIFRIKVDADRCTQCMACVRACPLEAAKGRVEGKTLPADCFSCGRCLNVCPEDAITYGLVGKKRPPA